MLGRVITYSEKGIKYEADPRHAEIIVEMLNLTNTKPVGSPGWKEEPDEGEPLEGEERTAYRALSARVNYLAQDRPDIQFAGKEICRFMQNPKSSDWMKLKKLGRYLRGKMRLVYHFQWQGKPPTLTGYTDTNWAGCSRTRRSTSAGGVMYGRHLIRCYSKTQATIALLSAEAELGGHCEDQRRSARPIGHDG